MPEVKNCRKCKRIFMYVTGPQICDNCKKLEDEDFEKVRKFVKEFPGATIPEVSKETGVEVALIYRFLKEERLEVAEGSPIALQCENCGTRIKSGRFCVECSRKLAGEMISAGKALKASLNDQFKPQLPEERGFRYMNKPEREK